MADKSPLATTISRVSSFVMPVRKSRLCTLLELLDFVPIIRRVRSSVSPERQEKSR